MTLTKVIHFSKISYYTEFKEAALRGACVDYTSKVRMVDALVLPTDNKELKVVASYGKILEPSFM